MQVSPAKKERMGMGKLMAQNQAKPPVREQIADAIRSRIISGDLSAGTRLREEELASEFGVSRSPIRDVLLQLSKEGLLVSKPNCGMTVGAGPSDTMQDLLIELRRVIEYRAAKIVARKLTNEDVKVLEGILVELEDVLEREDFTEATKVDISFHRYLINLAGGEDLVTVWESIVLRMRMNFQRIWSPKQAIAEHTAILDHLAAGDADKAIRALRQNIR